MELGGRGSTQPVASNLLERLSPTRIKNIWRVKAPCVRLVGEQKIGKANMHTSPIPTVGLLLPIYVISCAYFKIVRRAGGIENTITRPFRLAAAGAFPSFLIKKKKSSGIWGESIFQAINNLFLREISLDLTLYFKTYCHFLIQQKCFVCLLCADMEVGAGDITGTRRYLISRRLEGRYGTGHYRVVVSKCTPVRLKIIRMMKWFRYWLMSVIFFF